MKAAPVHLMTDGPLDPELGLGRVEVRRMAEELRELFGLELSSFTLRLVDDAQMAALNRAHLGLTGPTNVLSFPEDGEGDETDSLGEIALAVPTLLREARLYGQPVREHFVRLLAHALLHLAGHEHGPLMDSLTDSAVHSFAGKDF